MDSDEIYYVLLFSNHIESTYSILTNWANYSGNANFVLFPSEIDYILLHIGFIIMFNLSYIICRPLEMNISKTELNIHSQQSYSLKYSSIGIKLCTHHPKEK